MRRIGNSLVCSFQRAVNVLWASEIVASTWPVQGHEKALLEPSHWSHYRLSIP